MKIEIKTFGCLPNGKEVKLFSFLASNNFSVSITNYGGIITSIKMPDKDGAIEEITAGFDNLDQYLKGHPHFGVIVGRFANRIAKGQFEINGQKYQLPINNGLNHLHGGNNGFHTKLWDYELNHNNKMAILKLRYISPHLEEGYPGNLDATIIYTIHNDCVLDIEFLANTDAPTHVNLTSHGYFNLSGFKNDIFGHKLMVNANRYVEIDGSQIPTGKLIPCDSGPFNFSKVKTLSEGINAIPGGIDHCYALNITNGDNSPAATLTHEPTGRRMIIHCTHPGMQVYTGNSLDGSLSGHNGTVYTKNIAVCLEMQHFPDTPNHTIFPPTLLNPDDNYHQKATFIFETM